MVLQKESTLTANALKVLAMVTMTIDHIGFFFFPRVLWLRVIGRLAFPIYAYFIAEGCFFTHRKSRYFLRVFLLGLLCQAVSFFAAGNLYLSVLITFSLSILLIYAIQGLEEGFKRADLRTVCLSALAAAVLLVLSWILGSGQIQWLMRLGVDIDYGFFGILVPVLTYLGRNRTGKLFGMAVSLILLSLDFGGVQWYSLLALLPLALYHGEKGRWNMKYLFYLYYPAHIAAIYLISALIP